MKKSEKKKSQIAYKLIPTAVNRLLFMITLIRVILNGYFIYYSINYSYNYNDNNNTNNILFCIILLVSFCECYLFLSLFITTLYNILLVIKKTYINTLNNGYDIPCYETKNIAINIGDMSGISILRFIPSFDREPNQDSFQRQWKDKFSQVLDNYIMIIDNTTTYTTLTYKFLIEIFEKINFLIIVFGPLLSIFGLIFKVDMLLQDGNVAIISCIGFLNQLAQIRRIRLIEINALLDFVFRYLYIYIYICIR